MYLIEYFEFPEFDMTRKTKGGYYNISWNLPLRTHFDGQKPLFVNFLSDNKAEGIIGWACYYSYFELVFIRLLKKML